MGSDCDGLSAQFDLDPKEICDRGEYQVLVHVGVVIYTPFPHMDRFLYLGNWYFLLVKKNINHVNRSLQHTIVGKNDDWFSVDGMCKYLYRNNTNLVYYCLFGSMSAYAAATLPWLL